MTVLQETLRELDAQISKLRTEELTLLQQRDESIRQFDRFTAKTKPELRKTHRPWLIWLWKKNVEEFRVCIKKLSDLRDICEGLSGKSLTEQQQRDLLERARSKAKTVVDQAQSLSHNSWLSYEKLNRVLDSLSARHSKPG